MSTSGNSSRRTPRVAPIPRLIKPLAPLISWMTARYIAYHRRRLNPRAAAMPKDLQASMRAFFSASVLAETRIVRATMPEPILYPLVRVFGIQGMLEMSSIGAITLMDVVAYPDELSRGISTRNALRWVAGNGVFCRGRGDPVALGWQVLAGGASAHGHGFGLSWLSPYSQLGPCACSRRFWPSPCTVPDPFLM
jgi:hypothetical protein